MDMKLCRDSKIGKMKNIDISPFSKTAIDIGIGTLVMCGMFAFYNIASNSIVSYDDLDRYSTYSQQVESLYDVDISKSNQEILNSLQKNLDLVHQYNEAITDNERYKVLDQMMNTKSELTTVSLSILKQEYAEKHGGVVDNYDIYVSYKDGMYTARKLANKYGNVAVDESYDLNGKQIKLVEKVISLDETSYNKDLGIGKDSKEFVDKYESVIKETAKYIGKTSDKAK